MNNFYPVAFLQHRTCPFATPGNTSIQLNRNADRLQRQFLNQVFQTRTVRQFLSFSVYLNVQDWIPRLAFGGQNNFSQLGDFAVTFGLNQNRRPARFEVG